MGNSFSLSIEIGSLLTMECIDTKVPYEGRVIDVHNQTLTFEKASFRRLPILSPGTEVRLRITEGSETVAYHGTVQTCTSRECKIGNLGQWDSWERREFYRQKITAEGTIQLLQHATLSDPVENEEILPCSLLDISASGIQIACPRSSYVKGDQILVSWIKDVPTGNPFHFRCEIMRVEENSIGRFYGCKFLGLSEREQDKLVHAIFYFQQVERKRSST